MHSNEPNLGHDVQRLSDADGQVLDALIDARARDRAVGPLPAGSSERAAKLREIFSLLDQLPVEDPPTDLAERTVASITQAQQRARFATQIEMLRMDEGGSKGLNINMRQAASGAAILILGLSLLLPTLSRSQNESQRIACAANMGMMGKGFVSYANDHQDVLPRATPDLMQPTIQPGLKPKIVMHRPKPNSASLFLIIREDYVRPDHAVCPALGSDKAQANVDQTDFASAKHVPFSYQNQVVSPVLHIGRLDPRRPLLADRNPLYVVEGDHFVLDENRSPEASSDSHAMPGQNVLTASITVKWMMRPVIKTQSTVDDNIWIAQNGGQLLEPADDAFLTP